MSVPPPVPPQPPQPTPPAEATQPAPATGKPKPHALSIVAFVMAIVGFIFACIPGALIVGWILLPIAFILSIVALFVKGRKWPAITGLILAVVGTIVGVVVFLTLMAGAVSDAVDQLDDLTGDAPASQVDDEAADADADAAAADTDDAADADYAVTIDGAHLAEDYDGKDAVVVDFTFTNDSDKAANFMFALSPTVFQDGIELDDAVILADDSYDISSALKDIKPGKSLKVQQAYVLSGHDDIEVEVTELLSFDDTVLASKTLSVK